MVFLSSTQSWIRKRAGKGALKACAASLAVLATTQTALAQNSTANEAAYAALLQEIANLQMIVDRDEVYLATQEAEIDHLRAQIAEVPTTIAAIGPMVDKMTSAMETEIAQDIPFKQGERYTRLDSLKETIADAAASPGEKMRKALALYAIEIGYGQSLEAYDADGFENAGARRKACLEDIESASCALTSDLEKKLDEGATIENLAQQIFDGTYLRYGRMSLAYMATGSDAAYRYNMETQTWDKLPTSRALEVRRGIRIAKGESAPGVLSAPVVIAN